LNAVRQVVEGKRVVLVDDSIVRGTTSVRLTELLRDAGAKEVHMRISSPSFRHSCPYGLDTADESQLVATGRTDEEIEAHVGADSLRYLSPEGMLRALQARGGLADQFVGTYGRDGQLWDGQPWDGQSRGETGSEGGLPGGSAGGSPRGAAAGEERGEYCLACFTGRYPVPLANPGEAAEPTGGEREVLETTRARRGGDARRG